MNRFLLSVLLSVSVATVHAAETLHSMLPADAVAYLRIVGPDGFSGAAPGTPLARAVSGDGNAHEVGDIAAGLLKGLEANEPARAQAPWLELLYRLRGPIEAVLSAPPGQPLPRGRLLIRAAIEAGSIAEVNGLWQRLAAADEQLVLKTPLGADGVGLLTMKDMIPLWLKFDVEAQQLTIMAGLGLDRNGFESGLAALVPQVAPAGMPALEQQIDSGGQGPFLWLNTPRLLESMGGMASAQMMPMMMGLQGVKGLALGWGTRDGKGRISLVLDAPRTNGLTRMLPPIVNDFSLTSRGRPGLFVSLNVPGPALLQLADGLLAMNPEAGEKYREAKQEIKDKLGMTAEDLVAILGPEFALFSDDSGTFSGIRVADPAGLETLLQHFGTMPNVDYETRDIDGRTYYHLAVTKGKDQKDGLDAGDAADKTPLALYFDSLLTGMRSHFYWVQDGDWLIFGQVPQSLYDRERNGDSVFIGDWLRDQQRQDVANALIVLSTEWDNIPRSLYYSYLGGVSTMADLAGVSIDPFARPGATELQLPDRGSYGLQLNLGDPYLGLELSFEANPLEFGFGGSGAATVADVGILAAVAIPAYQDYTLRAKVDQAMMELTRGKLAVSEFYQQHGMLPSDRESAGLSADAHDVDDELLATMSIDNGRVTIVFRDQAPEKLQGKSISMTPYRVAGDDSFIHWRCGYATVDGLQLKALRTESGQRAEYVETTIESRYLPASCR